MPSLVQADNGGFICVVYVWPFNAYNYDMMISMVNFSKNTTIRQSTDLAMLALAQYHVGEVKFQPFPNLETSTKRIFFGGGRKREGSVHFCLYSI